MNSKMKRIKTQNTEKPTNQTKQVNITSKQLGAFEPKQNHKKLMSLIVKFMKCLEIALSGLLRSFMQSPTLYSNRAIVS